MVALAYRTLYRYARIGSLAPQGGAQFRCGGDALCSHPGHLTIGEGAICGLETEPIGQAAGVGTHTVAAIDIEQGQVHDQCPTGLSEGFGENGGK